MEVSPVSNQNTSSGASVTQLAENFDTFLTLLTTQLQNQDPLSPLDTNEFTSQLVEFSGVEQAIQTNTFLEDLVTLAQSNSTGNAVGYLGKNVTVLGNTQTLSGGELEWSYDLPALASQTALIVTDESGGIVYTAPGNTAPGSHKFVWDGTDADGNPLPEGNYSLQVSAITDDETPIEETVRTTGLVTGLSFEGPEPVVKLGQALYRLADILTIEEPQPTEE